MRQVLFRRVFGVEPSKDDNPAAILVAKLLSVVEHTEDLPITQFATSVCPPPARSMPVCVCACLSAHVSCSPAQSRAHCSFSRP